MTKPRATKSALRRAEALADAAAIVARRIPAPRGLPFYGLDHPQGALDRLLAALSDLGIFRVYSHVLDLTGGLGGPARWLARRLGCRVTLAESDPDVAAAFASLTARAHLAERVRSVVVRAESLPFAQDTFTHAWGIGARERIADVPSALAEVWRTLRPGGWLALAEMDRDVDALRAIEDQLPGAGFCEVTRLELDSLSEDESTAARLVAERASAILGVRFESEGAERPSFVGLRARKPA